MSVETRPVHRCQFHYCLTYQYQHSCSMSNSAPPKCTGKEANDIIYHVLIKDKDIEPHRAFSAIALCMGAFPNGNIPDIRRAERLARCLRITTQRANEALSIIDAMIDDKVFPLVPSHDESLIQLYQGDGSIESTGAYESVAAPIVVPHRNCVLCGSPLGPATEKSPAGHPLLLSESHKATRVHTNHGSFLAKEYPRYCTRARAHKHTCACVRVCARVCAQV